VLRCASADVLSIKVFCSISNCFFTLLAFLQVVLMRCCCCATNPAPSRPMLTRLHFSADLLAIQPLNLKARASRFWQFGPECWMRIHGSCRPFASCCMNQEFEVRQSLSVHACNTQRAANQSVNNPLANERGGAAAMLKLDRVAIGLCRRGLELTVYAKIA